MISRDRFEVILESISKGTAIENARNRLEMIFSAIAEKIGTGGGGGGGGSTVTRTTLGTYDVTQANTSITTLDMSIYDYLEITFAKNDTFATSTKYDWSCTFIYYYSEGGRFYAPMFQTTSSSPTYKTILAHFESPTSIVLDDGVGNSLLIAKVVGVKVGE